MAKKTEKAKKVEEPIVEKTVEIVETIVEPAKEEVGALDEEEYLKKTTEKKAKSFSDMAWEPKSDLGRKVKSGEVTDLSYVLDNGEKIKESEIVDLLLPEVQSDFLMIGQSKGKFGGGKRKIFRQTQKKTKEGNKPHFEIMAVVGNENGYVGLGYGKSKETVPAREKSLRNAKMSIIKIKRGCGSWQCGCRSHHSIPYKVEAKCGSVTLTLSPAPRGTGLKVEKECAKILKLAGIKDVYGRAKGKTTTKTNLVQACFAALRELSKLKTNEKYVGELGIVEGKA